MDVDDSARTTRLLASYLAADYKWELDGAWLPIRIGAPCPPADLAFPGAHAFGLLSAWNPGSVACPESVNRAADHRLQTLLETRDAPFRAGFASAPDRTWREPNWMVVAIETDALDALALQFGQRGTLAWRASEPVRLRMYGRRPAATPRHDCVDWVD